MFETKNRPRTRGLLAGSDSEFYRSGSSRLHRRWSDNRCRGKNYKVLRLYRTRPNPIYFFTFLDQHQDPRAAAIGLSI